MFESLMYHTNLGLVCSKTAPSCLTIIARSAQLWQAQGAKQAANSMATNADAQEADVHGRPSQRKACQFSFMPSLNATVTRMTGSSGQEMASVSPM